MNAVEVGSMIAALLILPATTSGFNLLTTTSPASSPRLVRRAVSPRLTDTDPADDIFAVHPHTDLSRDIGVAKSGRSPRVTQHEEEMLYGQLRQQATQSSRRTLLRGAVWATGLYHSSGTIACASAYTINKMLPDETETYAMAQKGKGPLRVLWVGPGDLTGVFKDAVFEAGNEVIALDLLTPNATDLRAATTYATEHGYQLRFEQGDATKLRFADASFDAVVCSLFLCQDFDPEVVVSEIKRVLKNGGRFGFYEHVPDIDKIIVGKVFGERSVIRIQAEPAKINVIAGVVRKV